MTAFGGGRFGILGSMVAGALLTGACASSSTSYTAAAIEASDAGDQAKAISLARKEVEKYSGPDQCSRTKNGNCGTLALALSSLAEYQILNGDRAGGENSFSRAKNALDWMDKSYRASAVAMVYRDVSEAYWKTGDRKRAVVVFNEGRAAGGDSYLYMGSAAKAAESERAVTAPRPASDGKPADAATESRTADTNATPATLTPAAMTPGSGANIPRRYVPAEAAPVESAPAETPAAVTPAVVAPTPLANPSANKVVRRNE